MIMEKLHMAHKQLETERPLLSEQVSNFFFIRSALKMPFQHWLYFTL
jgi:hypothetical protein